MHYFSLRRRLRVLFAAVSRRHIPIPAAFILFGVSIFRCDVAARRRRSRFAFREAALTQLVYLVGFSYAFFSGIHGAAITIERS